MFERGHLYGMAFGVAVIAAGVWYLKRQASAAVDGIGNAFDSLTTNAGLAVGAAENYLSESVAPVADRVWNTDLVTTPDAATGGHPSQGDVRRWDQYTTDYGSPLANLPNAVSTWAGQMTNGTADPYDYAPMG